MHSELIHKIFEGTASMNDELVLEIYRYQFENNPVYQSYCELIQRTPKNVRIADHIPYLPISFFKTKVVKSGVFEPETWFESSGTTGQINSKHYIRSLELYRTSFLNCFKLFYGDPKEWCIIGLLPSYLERSHSSLVYMVNELIRLSDHPEGGFHLYDTDNLVEKLGRLQQSGHKTLLFGVSFALLDLAAASPIPLGNTIIIETGGMKGRKKEITREALHESLRTAFPGASIHSEYGMTELLSQAYCREDGRFFCPPWMRILLRAEDDPFELLNASPANSQPHRGIINVMDLANINSCCFIATDDMGKIYANGAFEVLGRVDNSDIRGCSLMAL